MRSLRQHLDVASCFVLAISMIAGSPRQVHSQLSMRTDTMRHVRSDTATLEARRRRADSADLARQYRLDSIADAASRGRPGDGRLYYGVAAGLSQPVNNLHAGHTTGWNVTVPIGWDFVGTPFGVRADASWDRLTGKASTSTDATDLSVWSLNADATMRHRVDALGPSGAVYLLGGSGFANSVGGVSTRWGFNGGVGASLTVGQLAVFAETRYLQFRWRSDATGDARFLPMILGVTF